MKWREAKAKIAAGVEMRRPNWHRHNHTIVTKAGTVRCWHQPYYPKQDHSRDFPLNRDDHNATDWEEYHP